MSQFMGAYDKARVSLNRSARLFRVCAGILVLLAILLLTGIGLLPWLAGGVLALLVLGVMSVAVWSVDRERTLRSRVEAVGKAGLQQLAAEHELKDLSARALGDGPDKAFAFLEGRDREASGRATLLTALLTAILVLPVGVAAVAYGDRVGPRDEAPIVIALDADLLQAQESLQQANSPQQQETVIGNILAQAEDIRVVLEQQANLTKAQTCVTAALGEHAKGHKDGREKAADEALSLLDQADHALEKLARRGLERSVESKVKLARSSLADYRREIAKLKIGNFDPQGLGAKAREMANAWNSLLDALLKLLSAIASFLNQLGSQLPGHQGRQASAAMAEAIGSGNSGNIGRFLGTMRNVLERRRIVVPPGGLVPVPGEPQRRAGWHLSHSPEATSPVTPRRPGSGIQASGNTDEKPQGGTDGRPVAPPAD